MSLDINRKREIQDSLEKHHSENDGKELKSLEQYVIWPDIAEVNKLPIIMSLLPSIRWEDIPFAKQFFLVWYALQCCNFQVAGLLINTLYATQYNSLYPLIQQIVDAIDEPHYIVCLLHVNAHVNDFIDTDECVRRFVNKLRETFSELLEKDRQLAVRAFRVMVRSDSLALQYLARGSDQPEEFWKPLASMDELELFSPLKRLLSVTDV